MSMVSRFPALAVKSQLLQNVRFLHKLGSWTPRNLSICLPYSAITAITSRQFTLAVIHCDNDGKFQKSPSEGAFVSSSRLLPSRKGPSSNSTDDHNFNRQINQIKRFRDSEDLLQFMDTCNSDYLSTGSLKIMIETVFNHLINKKLQPTEKKRILKSVWMQKLCLSIKKHRHELSPRTVVAICNLFAYLNIPWKHPTFKIVLNRLLKLESSVFLGKIEFLQFLMNQTREESKSPKSELVKIAQALHNMMLEQQLVDKHLQALVQSLKYAVEKHYSKSALKKFLKPIWEKPTQLNYKHAKSIVQSLGLCRHSSPEISELLITSFKILVTNINSLDTDQLNALLQFCGVKSMNSILDRIYNEDSTVAACNRHTEAQQDEDMDIDDKVQVVLAYFKYKTMTSHGISGQTLNLPQCRHCAAKKETLRHVLKRCPKGDLLRRTAHHEIRSIIAKALREVSSFGQRRWTVEEEVDCQDENGSSRTVDIFCYDQEQKVGFIIVPTVHFEEGPLIRTERMVRAMYEPCAKYLKDLYNLDQVEVTGVFFGGRRTMTSACANFRKCFALSPTTTKDVTVTAIRSSSLIVHHHLYTSTRKKTKINIALPSNSNKDRPLKST